MKHKDFTGIIFGIRDATAFVQGNRSHALVVRPPKPKPNKADNPTQSGSS